ASFPICLMRSCSESRALFSWPEYVWTTYHFIAIGRSVVSIPSCIELPCPFSSSGRLRIDQAGDPRPEPIEHAEEDRRDDGGDDDHHRRRERLLARRPRDLAQFARDLGSQREHLLVPPRDHGSDAGDENRPGAEEKPVRFAEIAPRPVSALGQQPGGD